MINHRQVKSLPAMSLTIQSIPSRSPSPVLALHPIIPQCLVVISSNSKYFFIQSQLKLPSISCLLQKINKVAPINFSCFRRLCSYNLVSQSRILSELSTTHMTPSVCSKQFLQYDLMVFWPPISQTLSLKFSYQRDLMLKPSVGEILSISQPLNFLMMVVLPALSSPSTSKRISFSFYLVFFTIDMNPIFLFKYKH